ncbi:MAG TPA: ABC transporter ATP-binding protein [Pyrinomonadaceae bacterium]|jgi:lipopolysaccharide transport system ATP-binding protein|nr:ABC transporter ATP-binding protein [Pyrinomonadaceae bacterium]
MKPIITIENVSKRYRLGGLHPGYLTFRDLVGGALGRVAFKRRGDNDDVQAGERRRDFWALRDINLSVQPGELIGVIGRNGAGKSTLLKILSRVTKPTTGRVEMYGRVGSLLEVGTGFHSELSGRENVYLSGAILGMRRAEIERKFDEIVAFSELEKFIDTPVKRYSSGMYVRLAFSVAAHLEPEILIMDEVLAVGDAAFQQKCLDKMHAIRQHGRTIFFVSHSMPAVTRLCRRVILLHAGRIVSEGEPQAVVNDYLSASWNISAEREWPTHTDAPGNDAVRLARVRVLSEAGVLATAFDIRRPIHVEITYDVLAAGHILTPHVELHNEEGVHAFSSHDTSDEWRRTARAVGRYTSIITLPGNLLSEGTLRAHVSVMSHTPTTTLHAQARNVVAFQVLDSPQQGDSARGDYIGPIPGVVRPLLDWTTRFNAPPPDEHNAPPQRP